MKSRLAPVVGLLLLSALQAAADVSMKVTLTVKGPMPFGDVPFVIYVHGTSLRADARWSEDDDTSILVDAATGQRFWIDHHLKEVGPPPVEDMLTFFQIGRGFLVFPSSELKASLKPARGAREVLGRACERFDAQISQAVNLKGVTVEGGGRRGSGLTMKTSGPVWVAKEGPGVAEYRAFQEAASAAGILVWPLGWGDPVAGAADPKGIVAVQRALAKAGLPLAFEWKSAFDGSVVTMKVTEVSVEPISAEKFALPEGYTKK